MPPPETASHRSEEIRQNYRAFRSGLAGLVLLVILLAGIFTWWDIEQDRNTTLETSRKLTGSLAESVEQHIEATLRDSSNAALSAALLIEKNGGLPKFTEQRLHEELKRELWDETSTARLVVTDAQGVLVASSTHYPAARDTISGPDEEKWRSLSATRRPFRLGMPHRSLTGGELVLPFTCDILDGQGNVAGTVRAEIRISHFIKLYESITSLNQGAVVVLTNDGVLLMGAPLREEYLGRRTAGLERFLNLAAGPSGHLEFVPQRDNVARYFSWRRMQGHPLVITVGLNKDAVLQPWRERALLRSGVVAAACLGIVILGMVLLLYLRRLARSQLQLHESESNYWTVVQSSTIGICIVDMNWRRVHVNEAFCAMLGYTKEEMLSPEPDSLATEGRGRARIELERIMRSRDASSFAFEQSLRHKNGSIVWAHVHHQIMHDADNQPVRIIIHAQDITARKEAEQALRDVNVDLERRVRERTAELSLANQDLEAFSYSAAHDLRSPLQTLSGFLNLLIRDISPVTPKAEKRLDTIKRQVRQMSQLLDDLLAMARTSKMEIHSAPVDMNALIHDLREQLEVQSAGRVVEWRVDQLPDVRADRGLLRDAMANILGNALKYSSKREVAIIEVKREDAADAGFVAFFVRDNGAGFDMQYAQDLFAPFKRLHSGSEFEGTGVGLAIVKRIIERNGGQISGEGEPDKGATFRIILPAA